MRESSRLLMGGFENRDECVERSGVGGSHASKNQTNSLRRNVIGNYRRCLAMDLSRRRLQ